MSLFFIILLSIAAFSAIILILVTALSLVEAKFAPKGDAVIDINDGHKTIAVSTGKTLLSTLAAQDVYLPSACGGKGTCGECKCRVVEGGGQVLPTETGILSRREQKEQYRLSCQCKVKENLKLVIPPEILEVKKYECTVRSNNNVATYIKELILTLPEPMDFKPGGYIQIDVPLYALKFEDFDIDEKYHADWDKCKLRELSVENDEEVFRAYSMANHPAEKGVVILNVRIATPPPGMPEYSAGIASSYIFNLRPGDKVNISGPFGDFFIKDTDREMLYIGGGAGMAPLRSHLFHLFHTLKTERKVSYWYGARSKREIFYEQEFREIERKFDNFSFHVALSEPLPEDDWTGPTGFVHQVIYDQYLKHHEEPEEIEYYLCGPPLMNAAVTTMLDSLGVSPDMIAFDDFGE